MEHRFWNEKWEKNETGFHQDSPHPLLTKHFEALGLARSARVFVPLCGKSRDMLCLRDMGYRVLGLELSPIAVSAFFDENGLAVQRRDGHGLQRFYTDDIEIICGDFFSLASGTAGVIDAVFDRAALIAMPPAMRVTYVNKMRELLKAGTKLLLIALEYEDGQVSAPPFTVKGAEISRLYGDWCDIDLLEKADAEVKGVACHELAYRITVRDASLQQANQVYG